MEKHLLQVVKLLLIPTFLISLIVALDYLAEQRQGARGYAVAQQLAGLPDTFGHKGVQIADAAPVQEEDPYMTLLADIDLAVLREINSEVLGWITIPDTALSYPLVQGADNSYYLSHTWQGEENALGAIFLDAKNQGSLKDWNNIIYGHRMRNGDMFGLLHLYEKEEYRQAHPYIYVVLADEIRRYEVFAAYEASAVLADGNYEISFPTDTAKQAYLDRCMAQSPIEPRVVPEVSQSILTLSTCTGRSYAMRWIVQAALTKQQ